MAAPLIVAGPYIIESLIGQGSSGKVYAAHHNLTNLKVAIKIVAKMVGYPIDQILREVAVMRLLQHPNIISLIDVLESDTEFYIVLEYAPCGNLNDYILRNGPLQESLARKIVHQTLSAIYYCHSHSVAHRDLKAENFLFDSDMNVKLADFGFSTCFRNNQLLSTCCGTPTHAAPELFLGQPYQGPEVDCWSLGVILYMMFTAKLPFVGSNVYSIRKSVILAEFALLDNVSPDLQDMVHGLLKKNSVQRMTIPQAMLHPWTTKRGQFQLLPVVNFELRMLSESARRSIHARIVDRMVQHGYSRADVEAHQDHGPFSSVTATYALFESLYVEEEFEKDSSRGALQDLHQLRLNEYRTLQEKAAESYALQAKDLNSDTIQQAPQLAAPTPGAVARIAAISARDCRRIVFDLFEPEDKSVAALPLLERASLKDRFKAWLRRRQQQAD